MQQTVWSIFGRAGLTLLLGCSTVACADSTNDQQRVLSLAEVLKNPKPYDGKIITLDCYYYEAEEKVVLASKVVSDGTRWRSVQNGDVWVTWKIKPPENLMGMLNQLRGIGDEPDLYGRVKVAGVFGVAAGTGHLGRYKYTFQIREFCVFDEKTQEFMPNKLTGGTTNESFKSKPL